ncbi:MAG: hypothetical protein JW856_02625 [Dehalococcoidales bacterium]|nr:hypothetical protein [Dehalococcoidales bacterium]
MFKRSYTRKFLLITVILLTLALINSSCSDFFNITQTTTGTTSHTTTSSSPIASTTTTSSVPPGKGIALSKFMPTEQESLGKFFSLHVYLASGTFTANGSANYYPELYTIYSGYRETDTNMNCDLFIVGRRFSTAADVEKYLSTRADISSSWVSLSSLGSAYKYWSKSTYIETGISDPPASIQNGFSIVYDGQFFVTAVKYDIYLIEVFVSISTVDAESVGYTISQDMIARYNSAN